MRFILFVCACSLLAGCETVEEAAARDDAYCRSLSAVPGSDAYVQCRFILDQRRRQSQRQAGEALGQAIVGAAAN